MCSRSEAARARARQPCRRRAPDLRAAPAECAPESSGAHRGGAVRVCGVAPSRQEGAGGSVRDGRLCEARAPCWHSLDSWELRIRAQRRHGGRHLASVVPGRHSAARCLKVRQICTNVRAPSRRRCSGRSGISIGRSTQQSATWSRRTPSTGAPTAVGVPPQCTPALFPGRLDCPHPTTPTAHTRRCRPCVRALRLAQWAIVVARRRRGQWRSGGGGQRVQPTVP